jgi:hypothetical protein
VLPLEHADHVLNQLLVHSPLLQPLHLSPQIRHSAPLLLQLAADDVQLVPQQHLRVALPRHIPFQPLEVLPDYPLDALQLKGDFLFETPAFGLDFAETEVDVDLAGLGGQKVQVFLGVDYFFDAFVLLGSEAGLEEFEFGGDGGILQVLLLALLLHLPPPALLSLLDSELFEREHLVGTGVSQYIYGFRLFLPVVLAGRGPVLVCVDDVAHEGVVGGSRQLHLLDLPAHRLHLALHVGLGSDDQTLHLLLHLQHHLLLDGSLLPLHLLPQPLHLLPQLGEPIAVLIGEEFILDGEIVVEGGDVLSLFLPFPL